MRTSYRAKLAALCAIPLILALLLVTLIPAVWSRLAHAHPAAALAATACVTSPWAVVSTPNTGTTGDQLLSVSGVSSSDVWTVGGVIDLSHGVATPIAEHWNGSAWSLVPTASLGSSSGLFYLDGVAAVATNDVWAVGAGPNGNLIEQWNGTTWKVIASPSVTGTALGLSTVAALSATNVWAVGDYTATSGAVNTLIEHWDGTAWTIIPSSNPGTGSTAQNYLSQLAGVSANDLWAVGQYEASSGPFLTLAEHWDGTAWSVVPTPNISGQNSVLLGVAGVASNDMWAVGDSYTGGGSSTTATLIEHWNGSAWSVVSSPTPGTFGALFGVIAVAAHDVIAVGESTTDTLIEQWTGSAWSVVPSPDVATTRNVLAAVTAFSPTDLWAVGEDRSGSNPSQTLALHYRTAIKIKVGSGSAPTTSSAGSHILCPHLGAGGAASAGAFANPRIELMRYLRARGMHQSGA